MTSNPPNDGAQKSHQPGWKRRTRGSRPLSVLVGATALSATVGGWAFLSQTNDSLAASDRSVAAAQSLDLPGGPATPQVRAETSQFERLRDSYRRDDDDDDDDDDEHSERESGRSSRLPALTPNQSGGSVQSQTQPLGTTPQAQTPTVQTPSQEAPRAAAPLARSRTSRG